MRVNNVRYHCRERSNARRRGRMRLRVDVVRGLSKRDGRRIRPGHRLCHLVEASADTNAADACPPTEFNPSPHQESATTRTHTHTSLTHYRSSSSARCFQCRHPQALQLRHPHPSRLFGPRLDIRRRPPLRPQRLPGMARRALHPQFRAIRRLQGQPRGRARGLPAPRVSRRYPGVRRSGGGGGGRVLFKTGAREGRPAEHYVGMPSACGASSLADGDTDGGWHGVYALKGRLLLRL